jgi:hypothetical protein
VVETVTPSLVTLESARTFVPGWWLHAFESSVTVSRESNKFGVCAGSVLPSLDSHELGLLALLLGDIQRQIMTSENLESVVELGWTSALKHLSGVDTLSKERLGRVFDALPQIRFLVERGQNALVSTPLFNGESWSVSDAPDASERCLNLSLRPSEFAMELLTGYVDGHLDFLRHVTEFGRLSSVNRGRSPLVLWTPVWLELTSAEQVVYARMEAAMQTNGAWLRLDGLVGLSLEGLTAGVKLPKKAAESGSLLMDRLRLVGKLGRRLVAHGVIQKDPSHGYMALDSRIQHSPPALLWQASAERLRSHAEFEYFGLASSKILHGPVASNIKRICSVLAIIAGAEVGFARVLERIWKSISVIPGCGLKVAPGVMLQAHLLFLEWMARAAATSIVPLPKKLRAHGVIGFCLASDEITAARRFREFVAALIRSEDLAPAVEKDMVGETPFSVAFGYQNDEVVNQCRKAAYQAEKTPPGHLTELISSEKMTTELPNKLLAAMPVNRISVKQEHDLPAKQDLAVQKLRRIAQDELEKMMRIAPDAYRDLKTKYISSLDNDTKALVMDVQRRLDSSDFDRHLKVRLVRYMIEQPSTWKSAASGFLI